MTTPTRILTREDVARLCTMELALEAVEAAFLAHGRGEARMPVKVYLPLPEHAGDFRAMPSYLAGAAGVKWVNSHPQNPARHGHLYSSLLNGPFEELLQSANALHIPIDQVLCAGDVIGHLPAEFSVPAQPDRQLRIMVRRRGDGLG